MMQTVEDKIRDYIVHRYPALQVTGLDDHVSLASILDSLAVLGLVGFLEPEFAIELSPSDLTDENFETIVAISRLVKRLSRPAGQPQAR